MLAFRPEPRSSEAHRPPLGAAQRAPSRSRSTRRHARAASMAAVAFAWLGVHLSGGAAGCGGEDDATAGRRVVLATRATAGSDVRTPFTNALGWSVRVTRAFVSVGPLRYFDGAPVLARTAPPPSPLWTTATRRAWDFVSIREARAHPGHYAPGEAKGAMTGSLAIDLVAPVSELPEGEGVTGPFRSATFGFASPPAGPLAAELGGAVARVEGEAQKDGETRAFRFVATADDVRGADGEPTVEGCPFEEVVVEADGVVTVHVRLAVWLDQVDFAELPAGGATPAEAARGTKPHEAFARGLKKGAAYVFSFSPKASAGA